jgi:hypothetical protein
VCTFLPMVYAVAKNYFHVLLDIQVCNLCLLCFEVCFNPLAGSSVRVGSFLLAQHEALGLMNDYIPRDFEVKSSAWNHE